VEVRVKVAGPKQQTLRKLGSRALSTALVGWYVRARRDLPWRHSSQPYPVWISEIMLQQTQVERVKDFFSRFMERFPTVDALAAASEHEVLRFWEGLGYYRRARQLHAAARQIVAEHKGEFPRSTAGLRSLPGIGRYTAGAIASIAMNLPEPIVEANSRRVLARLAGYQKRLDRAGDDEPIWTLAKSLVPKQHPGRFNQALMDLGAMVCTPDRPLCGRCPLAGFCRAKQQGSVDRIPLKAQRREVVQVREVAIVARRGNRVLVERRTAGEWWAGLWDFPRAPLAQRDPSTGSAAALASAVLKGLKCRKPEHLATLKHSVTHHRITLEVVQCLVAEAGPRTIGRRWVRLAELPAMAMASPARRIALIRALREPIETTISTRKRRS